MVFFLLDEVGAGAEERAASPCVTQHPKAGVTSLRRGFAEEFQAPCRVEATCVLLPMVRVDIVFDLPAAGREPT